MRKSPGRGEKVSGKALAAGVDGKRRSRHQWLAPFRSLGKLLSLIGWHQQSWWFTTDNKPVLTPDS